MGEPRKSNRNASLRKSGKQKGRRNRAVQIRDGRRPRLTGWGEHSMHIIADVTAWTRSTVLTENVSIHRRTRNLTDWSLPEAVETSRNYRAVGTGQSSNVVFGLVKCSSSSSSSGSECKCSCCSCFTAREGSSRHRIVHVYVHMALVATGKSRAGRLKWRRGGSVRGRGEEKVVAHPALPFVHVTDETVAPVRPLLARNTVFRPDSFITATDRVPSGCNIICVAAGAVRSETHRRVPGEIQSPRRRRSRIGERVATTVFFSRGYKGARAQGGLWKFETRW